MPGIAGCIFLALTGAFSTFGQLAMTRGYRIFPAPKGALIMLFNIAVSAILSIAVLSEPVDKYTIIGGLMVFGSSIGVLVFKPIFYHRHPNRSF